MHLIRVPIQTRHYSCTSRVSVCEEAAGVPPEGGAEVGESSDHRAHAGGENTTTAQTRGAGGGRTRGRDKVGRGGVEGASQ